MSKNTTIDFGLFRPIKTTQRTVEFAKRFPPFINPKPIVKNTISDTGFKKHYVPEDVYGKVHYKVDEKDAASGPMMDNMQYGNIQTREPETKSGNTTTLLITGCAIFLLVNVVVFAALYYKCIRLKKQNVNQKRSFEDAEQPESSYAKRRKLDQSSLPGCNLMKIINKSPQSEDTYEAVKTKESSNKSKLTRQVSSSTIDPHTKVRDWIASEVIQKCSPRFFRSPKRPFLLTRQFGMQKDEPKEIETKMHESNSTLGRSPTRPVSPVEETKEIKCSYIPKPFTNKRKPEKVSVAVDATPSGRGISVLMQQPIELTKSLDCPVFDPEHDVPLRRSATLDNFFNTRNSQTLRRSSTSINLKFRPIEEPTVIKITHQHSRSDPAQDSHGSPSYEPTKKLQTFSRDINVTSRDEKDQYQKPLSPEEALMTIKRRNFPKVLPDLPGESKQSLAHKRRSMPAPSHLFLPIPEVSFSSQPTSPTEKIYPRFRPAPPPRTCSTLGRKQNPTKQAIRSPAILAEEPPLPSEPEITCNNLYVGPLIPGKGGDSFKLNTQPVYDNLRPAKEEPKEKVAAKTIITTDPKNPVKRVEPKIIIKPTMTRTISDPNKNKAIPRVVLSDDMLEIPRNPETKCKNENKSPIKAEYAKTGGGNKTESDNTTSTSNPLPALEEITGEISNGKSEEKQAGIPSKSDAKQKQKASQIPMLVKNSNTSLNKEFSSSESSPSEESDTGTVVKRV